ncbi:MAG TPA: tetratricopeptide repeat protein [Dongiaceae bacterium]|nr:tetratricopeptide repeat protein [Dongiaceae bacterium]
MGSSRTSPSARISKTALVILLLLAGGWAGCGKKQSVQTSEHAAKADSTHAVTPPAGNPTGPLAGTTDPRLLSPEYLKTLPPSSERDVSIGNAFFQKGMMDSALAYYGLATRRDPKNTAAWNYVGITLSRMERLTEAENAYKKAITVDAFYAKTHSNLGNLYLKEKLYDKAIAAFQRANSIDSTDTVNWLNMGIAYKAKGDLNGAIVSYRKAADCSPDDAEPWSRLGYIYAEKMLYKAARESWDEAVARDSSRTDLIANLQKLRAYAESTGTSQ